MDEQNINELEQELPVEAEPETYKPRPRYQVVAAWIGVAIMVLAFVAYCLQIAFGPF